MKRNILTILIVSLFAYSHPAMAQKWGKVSRDVLAITSIPEDPEADAVILFDVGEIKITPQFDLLFKRHLRTKILTEQGLKYADISIRFWHEDKIQRLKAHTILPDGKKVKLKKKDVFEKRDRSWKQKVFAIPGAEVGAVIEYTYEKYSKYITFLQPWYFQNREFTKVNKLTVTSPLGLYYSMFFTNFYGNDPSPAKEEFISPDGIVVKEFTWTVENLPAIRQEPYMTTPKDYLAAIYFQLHTYQSPYHNVTYIKTWDDLAGVVRKRYRPFLEDDNGLKELVLELLPEAENDRQKAQILYTYVKNSIETTPYRGLLSDQLKPPHQVVKDKKGSAVEKNLLLINLLKRAGLEAYPLLISTRNHGRFHDRWPQLQQLNHAIAGLRLGKSPYSLDTGDKYCPFGMLSPNDLSHKGLLVTDQNGLVIDIPMHKKVNMRHASTSATLTQEGDLICQTVLKFEGYRGMSERSKLSRKKEKDYIKEILEDRFSDVTIDTFKITGIDEIDTPLEARIDYRVHNYAQVVGDMVYLTPALIHRLQSNPFKREKRSFPVEFSYSRVYEEKVNLTIPENYQTLETPISLRKLSRDLYFTSVCQADSNLVKFQRHFTLNKVFYDPTEYPALRDTYEQIVNSDQGQIVLKRLAKSDE